MIRSMTGFGREHKIINSREILVEIRSVNHRYYEFNARLPRSFMFLEEKLKTLVQGKISRGKVEVSVSIFSIEGKEAEVSINPMVVEGYLNALRGISEKYELNDDISLSNILGIPDAFNIFKPEADEDEIWESVSEVASLALEKFVSMRETEGKRLKEDVLNRLSLIEGNVAVVEKLAVKTVEDYRNKLTDKLMEILADKNIDESRILTETAIFAEKTAVDEETVRLKSHLEQYRSMLAGDEAVGRKLDFLTQELNREVNTIGSKCQNIEVTRIVVDIKSEIEKIREQIQNIE